MSFSPLAVATFVGIIVNALFLITNKKQPSGLSGTYGGELVTDETLAASGAAVATTADTAADSGEKSEPAAGADAADTAESAHSGADKPDA